jgi:hypothetical protein
MLPQKVIDKLFLRLSNCYGSQWSSLWKDNDIDEVKDLWAEELNFFADRLEAFAWALDHLPERVPNLIQFKKLLNDAPQDSKPEALEWKPVTALPPAIAQELHKITKPRTADPKDWARKILKDVEDGIPRGNISVRFAKEALGIPLKYK